MAQETLTVEQYLQQVGGRDAKKQDAKKQSGNAKHGQAKQRTRHAPGVMNKTETRMDFELDLLQRAGQVKWYGFETHKLRLAKKTWLTIDFWIQWADGTIECRDVKGGPMEDDARVKVKVAAETYRQYKFTVWHSERGGAWREEVIVP